MKKAPKRPRPTSVLDQPLDQPNAPTEDTKATKKSKHTASAQALGMPHTRHDASEASNEGDNPFRLFFELAPDAVVIATLTGPIKMVNWQAEQLFGYSRNELIGAKIEQLIPERYRKSHPKLRGEYAEHPRMRPMGMGLDLFGRCKDGSEFPVEISLSPITLHGAPCVMAIIRDVTERKHLERQAHEALNALLALAEERRKLLQMVLD
ncbi:MAG TPA: PAS domain S-box protein, partial [Ktedonobacterales bacterium]|nr:PAS domain S-box protein [Ktedonobacterales bacterium]